MTDDGRMDPRRARSRAALVAAAIALVDERDTAEISVTDLAQRAGVTRVTLYQNFADRDHLLQEAGLARYRATVEQLATGAPQTFEGVVEQLLAHISEHRDFYRRLMGGTCGQQTFLAIQRFVAERVSGTSAVGGRELDEDERQFVGGGAMALLVPWLSAEGSPAPPAVAAARITAMIGRFRPALAAGESTVATAAG
ncbi:TetR/AcrR family transcriptional regulator [Cellulomonas sp. PhB143]|uniref:TetR/AcrR family transcriptional regulator n=1 Tax=Cellulomonas sp. PhB143 TaxID=2485186 RepID=UPI000FA65856|nr:TetR/AcrR family transcriptional regulator [Cellulomonas sp. PhB143]ROS72096.1 TetR family transcriptional regulator [Cellulomonas sp. PhB143]